jgi:hypothetical protein
MIIRVAGTETALLYKTATERVYCVYCKNSTGSLAVHSMKFTVHEGLESTQYRHRLHRLLAKAEGSETSR